MSTPTLFPMPTPAGPTPAEAGIACPQCGATASTTRWQTFKNGTKHIRQECASCGRFIRYLPQPRVEDPGGPPACQYERRDEALKPAQMAPAEDESWAWLGHIRGRDDLWRPVALATTLPRCWAALMVHWGRGDLLAIPVKSPKPGSAEPVPEAEEEEVLRG